MIHGILLCCDDESSQKTTVYFTFHLRLCIARAAAVLFSSLGAVPCCVHSYQVRAAETEIRKMYPEAAYVDLEPDSSTHAMYALEQYQTPALKKVQWKA